MSLDENMEQANSVIGKLTEEVAKEIVQAYARSLKKIRAELAVIYAKYGIDSKITWSEMQKYNRMANLEKQVIAELKTLTGKNAQSLKKGLAGIYEESFYRTAFSLESAVQTKLAYGLINPKVIQASIQNPISGLTLNERLAKNRNDIIIRIRQELTQGLIQGESYQRMAKRFKDALENDAVKAVRVAKTEGHRVQQEGLAQSLEHAENQGLRTRKRWVSTLDSKTRDSHQALDGKAADKDGYFRIRGRAAQYPGGFGVAEEDINCRCTIRIEIVGFETTTRRVRGEGVIPYTTYNEWKKNRISAA
ncbi:MAG: phage minor head protein [Bacillota bacterium]|nr:phage minor head protein [Bacillota bacterium]